MSSWPHTFATQYPSVSLSWLDDQFNQLTSGSTSTVSLAGASLVGFQQVSSTVTISLQSKMYGLLSVKDWGAKLDGTTSDTVAIANSAVTGTVYFPQGDYSLAPLPSSYPNTTFVYQGSIDIEDVPGSTCNAKVAETTQDSGSHPTKNHCTHYFATRPVGSGAFGVSDNAIITSAVKQGFPTSTVSGDIDGIYTFVRNSVASGANNGASAGYLANVGGVGGCYTEIMEGQSTLFDTSGTIIRQMQTQIGVLDPVGGAHMGFYAASSVGTQHYGLYLNCEPSCGWDYFVLFATASSAFPQTAFDIDGNGNVHLYDSVTFSGNKKTLRVNGSNAFSILDNAASSEIFTLDDTGHLFAIGSIGSVYTRLTGAAPAASGTDLNVAAQSVNSATAGGVQAVPATVLGYLQWNLGGTTIKVPYFAA